jgi:actin-related protein 9
MSLQCQSNIKSHTQDIPARVGLRKNASGEYLNKAQLPITSENGANGTTTKTGSPSNRRDSEFPFQAVPGAAVHDYLVGETLDEALAAEQDIMVSWPFADGLIRDWTQAEAIWYVSCFLCHEQCC